MDQKLAAEIQRHLLEAAAALDRATQAMFRLDREERKSFADMLFEVHDGLHYGLLRALYAEHPELKPPGETRKINSTLRWRDVTLPQRVSETDVDAVIADVLPANWQKTAIVITRAFQRCQELELLISPEMLGARIAALGEAERLQIAGDPRMWHHSEVRAKP